MKVPVLLPRIFDHPHTYLSKKYGKLKAGSIVSVPFGKEEEIGVVWDKEENTNKNFKLKNIKEKKDVSLSHNLVKFIKNYRYVLLPLSAFFLSITAGVPFRLSAHSSARFTGRSCSSYPNSTVCFFFY